MLMKNFFDWKDGAGFVNQRQTDDSLVFTGFSHI